MLGIGPMLPVIPAADNVKRSFKKERKRSSCPSTNAGSDDLPIMRRPSTIKTESTLIDVESGFSVGNSIDTDNSDKCSSTAVKKSDNVAHHQRDLSLIVDIERAAKLLKNGVISDLDLALFAYWIKAKPENYTMAKALVRELGLDRGYNIEKITNERMRKLLQEVHDMRPRDPRHALTRNSPFLNQTQNSGGRTSAGTRVFTSPLTARMDTLPPSLRLKRDLVVQEAARPTIAASNTVDYPPNTPDRPAPLSVKSRSSQVSNFTPAPGVVLRSVSTPARTRTKEDPTSLAPRMSDDMPADIQALSPHPSSVTATLHGEIGDIFDDVQDKQESRSNAFTTRLNNGGDKRRGIPGRYMQDESRDQPLLARYQLDTSDIASTSSYSTSSSIPHMNVDYTGTDTPCDGRISDEIFDALESYKGTEDEDECSLLESLSSGSDQNFQTQYLFAAQAPVPQSVIAGPVPTPSERRANAESRQKSQAREFSTQAVNFHRPLPLRSYESEATMFPTAGSQADSGRKRSKSVTSIVNSTRCATGAMQHPPLQAAPQVHSSFGCAEQERPERKGSYIKISEQVDQQLASVSKRHSNTSTLAAFPIPPMENPVGELPILVSRATTSHPCLHQERLQHSIGVSSPEATYRAITKVNMKAVLQRTRARGEQLHAIDWESLSSFERAWRDMNHILLVTIFGRKDIFLDESDVAYIDCIARELCDSSNDTDSMAWVRRMFEEDI